MDIPGTHRKADQMRRTRILLLVGLALIGLMAAGCGGTPVDAANEPAVTVEAIEGTDLKRITLSEAATGRLGVETAPVAEEQVEGARPLVIPYSAVIYDAQGSAWVYVNTEGRAFQRHAIVVDRITGDRALLLEGPSIGALVATVGVAELWGVETGVGGGR
jgi:hypothetical protein